MIAAAVEDSNDPSKPTCACWVGARSNCFAVGYDDGSILVWGVPASTLKCRFFTLKCIVNGLIGYDS